MKKYTLFLLLAAISFIYFAGRSSTAVSPRFNHVMLYVSDLDASVKFYTTAFDLEVVQRITTLKITPSEGSIKEVPVKMVLLQFPGQDFVLELGENKSGDTDMFSPSYQHLGIDVMNIQSAEKQLLLAGAELLSPVQEVNANQTVAKNSFYKGPDGELIELMQILEGEF